MNISVVTAFPRLYDPFLSTSLIGRAREAGHVAFDVADLFNFVQPNERIDAPTFGHGSGMLLRPEVVQRAVESQEKVHGDAYKVFFSPHGKPLTQRCMRRIAKKMQNKQHLMLLPARYEGMDARVEDHYADEIISVGDFVLMGGDLPAMMFLEGLLRLIPGVIGKKQSVEEDSFTGAFLDYPSYTEPVVWQDKQVPDVVRSGNHDLLHKWRSAAAAKSTALNNFQWFRSQVVSKQDRALMRSQIPNHYVALLHGQVLIGPDRQEGTTSVTSIDLHDISRAAKTYDLSHFFVVTPLVDQQKIVNKLLDFWHDGPGKEYNRSRYDAIRETSVVAHLDEVVQQIEEREGKRPLIVTTTARSVSGAKAITYNDQGCVWSHDRPVLFVLGTGRGLAPVVMDRADFTVVPIEGFSDFNHLSVRSAAAIIFDRWLGLNQAEVAE